MTDTETLIRLKLQEAERLKRYFPDQPKAKALADKHLKEVEELKTLLVNSGDNNLQIKE